MGAGGRLPVGIQGQLHRLYPPAGGTGRPPEKVVRAAAGGTSQAGGLCSAQSGACFYHQNGAVPPEDAGAAGAD